MHHVIELTLSSQIFLEAAMLINDMTNNKIRRSLKKSNYLY
jgi:hypothetical protein